MTIDPETLMAYADGELDPLSIRRVEKAIATDPALAAQVAAHRTLRAKLASHFAPMIEAPLPDRLTALLDQTVVPIKEAARTPASFRVRSLAAVAAALVIGLMLGQMIDLGTPAPVGSRQGQLIAQGDLARSLDTQLASAQRANAVTRIGLTFRSDAGNICRTFEDASLSGIACRAGDEWQLKRVIAGKAQTKESYRHAGSADIMDAAQAMMVADPMDAADERKARESGWR